MLCKRYFLMNTIFCVRHLHQNFQKASHKGEGLKNDMWAIARSTNMVKYHQNMNKLKADSATAFDWVEELVSNTWIKAFFSDFPKCVMLLYNHCEVFNRYCSTFFFSAAFTCC